ncbi:glyoxal reductase-like [Asterias rubens]|uniref:glyoxal reductase-like n=1 Tax=Asterias rubens TaxID=7604 RepID=UPI001454E44A|nr:glyoxal reductase-like [Asterias rubens]
MKFVTLNTGDKMPIFGLGTFQLVGEELVHSTLDTALKLGYRAIDTASVYRNETDLGNSVKELLPKYGLSRSDLFITSKLDPRDHGLEEAYSACKASLDRLQLDYLDLYLIHWPAKAKLKSEDTRHPSFRKESWIAFERLYKEGKVKNIGVSNYTVKHMEEMGSYASMRPSVLQVEFHPFLVQTELQEWCKANDVHLQAYTSLKGVELLSDPVIVTIAERTDRTPAQVLLQWAVQQNIGTIPMSTNPEHIAENIGVFRDGTTAWLTDKDISEISRLHRGEKFRWDPSHIL